jgi:hypothetical protein
MEFTFLLPEDLKTAAETAQEYARCRRATPEDCFLVTPVSDISEGAAVAKPLSSSQIRERFSARPGVTDTSSSQSG